MLLLDDIWSGGEHSKSSLSLMRVTGLACLEESAQQFWPNLVWSCLSLGTSKTVHCSLHTFHSILPSNLRNCVSNLVPNGKVLFTGQAIQQHCANSILLRFFEGCEEVLRYLSLGIFSSLARKSSKEHSGKRSSLQSFALILLP